MFAKAAAGAANTRGASRTGRGLRVGRHGSRVRGLAETMGELPAACLAEEIDTPGEGQIRAMVTVAGNPVLSTPNGDRLDAAMAGLDLYVAVDIYLNETTRHADVILPPPSSLSKGHYDLALLQVALRNVANYSPPVLPLEPGQPDEWEILARLALIAQGMGKKANAGFYAYDDKGQRLGLWDGLAGAWPVADTQPELSEVQHRMLFAQVLEAVRALEEGVLEDIREGDVGAILGWGFCPWSIRYRMCATMASPTASRRSC